VGLFEAHETIGNVMALQQQALLEKNGLIYHAIVFMKDEGNNLKKIWL
jgi:phosphoribosyl-ATP pyrophosphohydrolase